MAGYNIFGVLVGAVGGLIIESSAKNTIIVGFLTAGTFLFGLSLLTKLID